MDWDNTTTLNNTLVLNIFAGQFHIIIAFCSSFSIYWIYISIYWNLLFPVVAVTVQTQKLTSSIEAHLPDFYAIEATSLFLHHPFFFSVLNSTLIFNDSVFPHLTNSYNFYCHLLFLYNAWFSWGCHDSWPLCTASVLDTNILGLSSKSDGCSRRNWSLWYTWTSQH